MTPESGIRRHSPHQGIARRVHHLFRGKRISAQPQDRSAKMDPGNGYTGLPQRAFVIARLIVMPVPPVFPDLIDQASAAGNEYFPVPDRLIILPHDLHQFRPIKNGGKVGQPEKTAGHFVGFAVGDFRRSFPLLRQIENVLIRRASAYTDLFRKFQKSAISRYLVKFRQRFQKGARRHSRMISEFAQPASAQLIQKVVQHFHQTSGDLRILFDAFIISGQCQHHIFPSPNIPRTQLFFQGVAADIAVRGLRGKHISHRILKDPLQFRIRQ